MIRTFLLLFLIKGVFNGNPCAPRQIDGESIVCVCNSTFCDDVTRYIPELQKYVAYTSSKAGLRFNVTIGDVEPATKNAKCTTTFVVDTTKTYQTIEGFGGAVTDAAGINWKNLSETVQGYLIDSYFGDNGLQYNMIRVPIGGSDFSTHAYAYNELPEDDLHLSNFSLTTEDYDYKIPMIKAILDKSSNEVHIVATTWSPPTWMKTNDKYSGFSRLKEEYYQTYADYHIKFLEEYDENGIKIWAITTTNEPLNGVIPIAKFNSLGWTPDPFGKWISTNLGPTVRDSKFSDLKILAVDDQRFTLPLFFKMVKEHPKVLDYIDGIAVHFYGDIVTPATILTEVGKAYPDKFILGTEACEGSYPWQKKVLLGSWSRAQTYVHDILTDLNHNLVGWIDWNMCLNTQGGPNWAKNYVDSPIIVFPENDEFVKQPMFYAMGHFSKFIPRGSVRIDVKEQKCWFSASVGHVAFLTPDNTIVAVLYNTGGEKEVVVKYGSRQIKLDLPASSVMTVEFSN